MTNILDGATLQKDFTDLQKEVGRFLGYGVDTSLWDATETAEVAGIIEDGLQRFYFPDTDDADNGYEWSFLYPTVSFASVADQEDYDLPEEFGGLQGDLTLSAGAGYYPIQVVGEQRIRALRQESDISGVPRLAAVRMKAMEYQVNDARALMAYEILLYPTPDAVYTITYKCFVTPTPLVSGTKKYPLGGPRHGLTVQEGILAVAESRKEDNAGIHEALFQRRLRASIAMDKKMKTPEQFGYMGDNSDAVHRPVSVDLSDIVTYQGNIITGV